MKSAAAKVPILIVDDRPENLLALESVLTSPHYELIRANSGAEALAYLTHHTCALILLDVQMPIMDGFETALLIRKNPLTKNIPIMFLTASIEDKDRVYKGYEAGAIDYLFKPFEPEILRSKVSFFVQLFNAELENKYQAARLKAQDEKNVSTVLDNALDAVVGMNAEGQVIYWNLQAQNIFGWSKTEALGQLMSDLIIPQRYRHLHENGLRKFLATGEGPILNQRIEISALNRKGTEFPVELNVTAVERSDQFTFTAFVRDISEKKKIEEDKKKEKELLQNALKLRDEFISICSHELNTPITSMKLQFQMAKRSIDQGSDQAFSHEAAKRRVEMTIGQIERMSRLISDMLDVSKISTGKLELSIHPVDLVEVINDVLERFQEQFETSGTQFKFTPALASAIVEGDQYRLEQVVSNLVTNAMKYGEGKPILIRLESIGKNFHLSVKDEGMGIEKENLLKIFSKFERAIVPNEISGLGLGLYITKQIVDSHKGSIRVESEKGHGSTFTVILPAFEKSGSITPKA